MKVADLDPQSAVTVFSAVKSIREHPTRALTPVDLENAISQAVWKFYNECRREASDRLGVGEMDLEVTDARVVGIKIDGHQVINPSGFTGRELEVKLSISMARKDGPDVSGTPVEGGSFRAFILSELEDVGRGFYVETDNYSSHLFTIKDGHVSHHNSFDWGRDHLDRALREALDLDNEAAYAIYEKYVRGEVSSKVDRLIKKTFLNSFTEFLNALSMNLRNEGAWKQQGGPVVYLNIGFVVPETIYRKSFNFGKKKLRFQEPPSELSVEDFLTDTIHGIYEDLNELAWRRIKWATPSSR